MKAAVYRRYGPPDVVRVEELPTPQPGDGEVLVRVSATTVSSGDAHARSLTVPAGFGLLARPVFGLVTPRKPILGTELSGEVAAVGRRVTKFKVGERVFAFPGFGLGCHAEYRTLSEDGRVLPMPAGSTFEEAAAISFGGTTALHFLRDLGRVQAGQQVLVIGGSGTVGSAAVQIARHLGAVVTAVTSGPNVQVVRELGADRVIDYTQGPWSRDSRRYDVIFDAVGGLDLAGCRSSLARCGRLLLAVATLPQMVGAGLLPRKNGHKVFAGTAHARVDTGHKRGSVVVSMNGLT